MRVLETELRSIPITSAFNYLAISLAFMHAISFVFEDVAQWIECFQSLQEALG